MFIKSPENIKYIFSTIKSSFLPAFLLFIGLVTFYAQNPYNDALYTTLHYLFFFASAVGIVLLCLSNQSKPLFSLLLGVVSYIIINQLKIEYGANYASSSEFYCLCFVLPINFVFLYFLPQSDLRARHNTWLLLGLLLQAAILSHIHGFFNFIPHVDISLEAVPLWGCMFWIALLTPLAINISFKNTIVNTGLFYADTALFMGIVYSDSPSGLTTFFLGFALILLCVTILDLYHSYHCDYLENVGSKTSYMNHANSKFPFKYTIAMFSIDNRDKLIAAIGKAQCRVLDQMVVNRILEIPYDFSIYRYNESELIMVFKNEDARHVKEFADNIRRSVAASEFVFASHKSVKITISVCVSEKTRKDLDAAEVTERTHNALQKNYRFNCNITTKV